jgi:hypothetical protein
MGLFAKKPGKYKKERVLQDNFNKPVRRENTNQEDLAEELAKNTFGPIKRNIDLANKLLPLFEEKCRATHIFVPEIMTEVRSAVKRKDSSNILGDKISFALFLTCIKKYEELKIEYALTIQDSISDNPEMAARSVTRLKSRVIAGISEEDYLLFVSLWLLNYSASKYQQIFNVPMATSIANKHSEGAGATAQGVAILISATAFATAVDTIYENLNDLYNLRRTNVHTDETPILEGNRLDQLALKKVSEGDYETILNFAVRYIYSSGDQKYDPWINYLTTRQTRNASIDAYKYYPAYSKEIFLKINSFSDKDDHDTDYVQSALSEEFDQRFAERFRYNTNGLIGLSQTLQKSAARNNAFLLTAGQSASYRMKKSQTCCLVRILTLSTQITKRDIKIMRSLLRCASSSITITESEKAGITIADLKAFDGINYAVTYARSVFASLLGQLGNNIYNNINDNVERSIGVKCLAFFNLQQLFIEEAEALVSKFNNESNMVFGDEYRRYLNSDNTIKERYRLRLLNDTQYILSRILDEALYECSDISDDIADENINATVSGLELPSEQYTIDIPEDVLDEYFSDSQPIQLNTKSSLFEDRSKLFIPAIDRVGGLETSEEVIRNILRTCKIELSTEEIKRMLKDTDGTSR